VRTDTRCESNTFYVPLRLNRDLAITVDILMVAKRIEAMAKWAVA
jgi:hypothetical protein